jgi:pimeloyl-ACP methyl ester carboxylesterase
MLAKVFACICIVLNASIGMAIDLNANKKSESDILYNHFANNNNESAQSTIENVTIYAQEGPDSAKKIARKGILIRFKDAKATILVAHGFMCNKHDVGFLRNLFPYGKYNFLTFDFRAHGEETKGQFCTLGRDEAYDVIGAAKFLRAHPALKNKPLFAYAFSMGAVATIEAQAKDASLFDALILDCPFDSTENVLKKCLENVKFSFFGYEFNIPGRSILEKYAFHPYVQSIIKAFLKTVRYIDPRKVEMNIYPAYPVKSAQKISVPCFFIHCKQDEKVTINAVKSVYNNTAGPKMLWLTNGRNHYDSFFYNPEKYISNVRQFLDQVMLGQWKSPKDQKIIEDLDDSKTRV